MEVREPLRRSLAPYAAGLGGEPLPPCRHPLMCRTRVKRVLRGRDALVPLPRSSSRPTAQDPHGSGTSHEIPAQATDGQAFVPPLARKDSRSWRLTTPVGLPSTRTMAASAVPSTDIRSPTGSPEPTCGSGAD